MKKSAAALLCLFCILPMLSACTGGGNADATILYGILAGLSILLLLALLFLFKEKEKWLRYLFLSVATVNLGYFLLALSKTVPQALMANRLSYLGSVFLPLTMLMSILQVCGIAHKRWATYALLGLGGMVFLIAASPGILPIYYKEVSLGFLNGATILVKTYGPLHNLYLFYLLSYFGGMIAAILYSAAKKKLRSYSYAITLAAAVFVNIFVWFLEKYVHTGFEALSLSYIISELFLFGISRVLKEAERLHPTPPTVDAKAQAAFLSRLATLTKTERKVLDLYLQGYSSAEIMETLNIKENTLKYHNKNIYSKMDVSKRKELLAQGTLYLENCDE